LSASLLAVLLAFTPLCVPSAPTRPRAVVAPDRSAHLLDRPYPSDELLADTGTVVLQGFPVPSAFPGNVFAQGWVDQAAAVVRGFTTTTPIYFRFESEPALAGEYAGSLLDPVVLRSLDRGDTVPLRVRWVEDSLGDPFLPNGTLVVVPDESHPLRSGERYVAFVSRRVAERAEDWTPPDEAAAYDPAVATVFTVQDVAGDLRRLRAAADAFLDADPSLLTPAGGLREVASLAYTQGRTPSNRRATLETVTFADGGTEVTYLDDTTAPEQTIDLTSGPMAVYQATIQTVAFQPAAGRPYQSPGLAILFDTTRTDGWIDFDLDGTLLSAPRAEPMRVVVQVPRAGSGFALLDWAHGSGGDAYESVARVDPANDVGAIRAALAARGVAVVGGDQPLFGRRFDFQDKGYEDTLLVVNIPNLPAFRANVQQGAIDQHVRLRFARTVLPALLGDGVVDPARVAAFGHSIGAQMAGVASGMEEPGSGAPGALLINGTGGFITHSVLASDLFEVRGSVGAQILRLAGLEPDPDAEPAEILGALFGVPEDAWPNIDRHHPLSLPFQLVVEGADPLAVAPVHAVPTFVFAGENDSFVPPDGFAWLAAATPAGALRPCAPATPYNGHYCVFRDAAGLAAFAELIDAIR
jgi:hypothetical protein